MRNQSTWRSNSTWTEEATRPAWGYSLTVGQWPLGWRNSAIRVLRGVLAYLFSFFFLCPSPQISFPKPRPFFLLFLSFSGEGDVWLAAGIVACGMHFSWQSDWKYGNILWHGLHGSLSFMTAGKTSQIIGCTSVCQSEKCHWTLLPEWLVLVGYVMILAYFLSGLCFVERHVLLPFGMCIRDTANTTTNMLVPSRHHPQNWNENAKKYYCILWVILWK